MMRLGGGTNERQNEQELIRRMDFKEYQWLNRSFLRRNETKYWEKNAKSNSFINKSKKLHSLQEKKNMSMQSVSGIGVVRCY